MMDDLRPMSIRVMTDVWDGTQHKGSALLLMLALADWSGEDGEHIFPSVETMGEKVRMSERNTQYLLQRLLASQELIKIKAGGGAGNVAHYKIDVEKLRVQSLHRKKKRCKPASKTVQPVAPDPSLTINLDVPLSPQLQNLKDGSWDTNSPTPEEIYTAYPRKVGKPVAIRAIIKALASRQFSADELLALTLRYARAVKGSDPQFIPHPATWFNQHRFNDDPSTWTTKGQHGQDKRRGIETGRGLNTANEGKSPQYRNIGKVRNVSNPEGSAA